MQRVGCLFAIGLIILTCEVLDEEFPEITVDLVCLNFAD